MEPFQSTLPYGSDKITLCPIIHHQISIHAPLRERVSYCCCCFCLIIFQSTLPYGSEYIFSPCFTLSLISIHAPLRERNAPCAVKTCRTYFNPRSLTGAIKFDIRARLAASISIHAPLRERLLEKQALCVPVVFQSTLPYGSEASKQITSLLI